MTVVSMGLLTIGLIRASTIHYMLLLNLEGNRQRGVFSLMDLLSLAYILVGAVVILALINIFRNVFGSEGERLDFDLSGADMHSKAADPYASRYNAFLVELEDLPEEYAQYVDLDKPSTITIPARVPIVGDLQVRFAGHLIVVRIGDHTEQRFAHQYAQAGKFILNIMTDLYVFHIYAGRVDIYERGDFLGPDDMDRDFYVWSGRLLDQLLWND
jgi:hypothetical protein